MLVHEVFRLISGDVLVRSIDCLVGGFVGSVSGDDVAGLLHCSYPSLRFFSSRLYNN